ncbi:MAG: hypothetical protein ACRD5F_02665 [Candidatus Acidiferrales bacterium]
MGMFEDAGQVIDQELQKIRRFLRTEVKPNTLRGAADALRAASRRLTKLAEDFEGRLAENKSETKP